MFIANGKKHIWSQHAATVSCIKWKPSYNLYSPFSIFLSNVISGRTKARIVVIRINGTKKVERDDAITKLETSSNWLSSSVLLSWSSSMFDSIFWIDFVEYKMTPNLIGKLFSNREIIMSTIYRILKSYGDYYQIEIIMLNSIRF